MSISERSHEYALLRWIDLESTKIDERLISILTDYELGDLHNKKVNIIKTNLKIQKYFFVHSLQNGVQTVIMMQSQSKNYFQIMRRWG